jgi:hypothetical protein
MAQVNGLRDWKNGDVVNDVDYEKDLELLRVGNNDTDKRVTDHKNASVLDHPNGSVTAEKLASNAVTKSKIADGAVDSAKLDPLLLQQLTGGTVDISGLASKVDSQIKLFWGSVE